MSNLKDMDIKQVIANRLSIARKNAGLSQGQAAKLLNIHRPTISEIEAGRRKVTAEELVKFSELYEVELNWLTGKDEDSINPQIDEISLAARKLENISKNDLDSVIELLNKMRSSKEDK